MSSAQDQTAGYEGSGAGGRHETATMPEAGYQRGTGPDGYGAGGNSGSTVLAATLMMLAGLWGFFEGLVGILHQSFFTSQANYTFQWSVHSWGWLHLILGIVVFAAGACVLLGQPWAKALGIVLAVFSGIANFIFLPYYPVWAIVLIAIDIFVVWALASSMGRATSVS
jgi:hypothetical protein